MLMSRIGIPGLVSLLIIFVLILLFFVACILFLRRQLLNSKDKYNVQAQFKQNLDKDIENQEK